MYEIWARSEADFCDAMGIEAYPGALLSSEFMAQWLISLRKQGKWTGFIAVIDGVVIGSSGFKCAPTKLGEIEIGYGFAEDFWGKGAATKLVAEMSKFCFDDPAITAVIADTFSDNIASQRVLQKNEFGTPVEFMHPDDGLVLRHRLLRK